MCLLDHFGFWYTLLQKQKSPRRLSFTLCVPLCGAEITLFQTKWPVTDTFLVAFLVRTGPTRPCSFYWLPLATINCSYNLGLLKQKFDLSQFWQPQGCNQHRRGEIRFQGAMILFPGFWWLQRSLVYNYINPSFTANILESFSVPFCITLHARVCVCVYIWDLLLSFKVVSDGISGYLDKLG